MTAAEWRACTDPLVMLDFLRGKASDRKVRLFACGFCRRNWHLLPDGPSRKAVEISERYADGQVKRQALSEARRMACKPRPKIHIAYYVASDSAWDAAVQTADAHDRYWGRERDERRMRDQCELLCELFGDPLLSAAVNPAWLYWNDGAIRKMAQLIYDHRGFDRLPLFADTLEDAGCTDADILNHCRQPGEHVRGCWAVDLLLGKS